MKYKYDKEILVKLVSDSKSYSEVMRKLGMKSKGSNIETLKEKLKQFKIDTSHFLGKGWSKGKKLGKHKNNLSDYLSNRKPIQTFKLKKLLLKAGLKENKCEICGISSWNNKKLNCVLHHIDGNPLNNNIQNLMILCPNCHSQTNNFKAKKH